MGFQLPTSTGDSRISEPSTVVDCLLHSLSVEAKMKGTWGEEAVSCYGLCFVGFLCVFRMDQRKQAKDLTPGCEKHEASH